MKSNSAPTKGAAPGFAAIACGGTGGHLFPGLAVGRELRRRGCRVALMISSKEIDQRMAGDVADMEIVTLPAVGLTRGSALGFVWRSWQAFRLSKQYFRRQPPRLVLAMGGFTGAPPVLAGKRLGARVFLHESNTIAGRANRWLSRTVDGAFVYFDSAASSLKGCRVEKVGMPVRQEFLRRTTSAEAREALGLDPAAPVLLVMGGSQGARKVNEIIRGLLPRLLQMTPDLQFIHLTGASDLEETRAAYSACGCRALVRAFLAEMGLALAAADVAVSRAGASSLAEFAACGLPAFLIPYPTAADNHQFYNAQAFVQSGAARMYVQGNVDPDALAREITSLLGDPVQRLAMREALRSWHQPEAASEIAGRMLEWQERLGTTSAPVAPRPEGPKLGVLNV
ncbi:MAG: undecaprenyldiphospho-muramoylpentapeptide beta-N-acetylglucosaminyltransferase [Bryobacteraceae bacterium]